MTAVKRSLDELVRSVGQLERDLAREKGTQPPPSGTAQRPAAEPMVSVPDTPYDASKWRGAEDEGLGHPGRHAP
ncbi:hypothetical protein [Streptomyces sp. MUM 203J]|uniref:hypothetical protein n=1 Tax=Streptomyces sp. MUM 203J TaxID=2791990 RepID=UPI0035AC2126